MDLKDMSTERADKGAQTVPARILIADDDPHMQLAISTCLSRKDYELVVAPHGAAALEHLEKESFDLVLTDQQMPEMSGLELLNAMQKRGLDTPVIMITAYGTINQAVEAMQNGASDFITKPFSAPDLERTVERCLTPEAKASRQKGARRRSGGRPIVTNDPLMIRVLEVAEAVARSEATVLIQGESGTGKELVARFIHASSPRAQQTFVAVNCAALPATLLESELFGHEKGAFTGAQARKIGKFELAHGGTILLDEISEMDLALQAKLLRVLQEREVDRVGGKDPVTIDVRVLATTNRNLEDSVREGKFRSDLYYRLNVIPLTLPPLRERASDIKLLTEHFMRQYLGDGAGTLPEEVLQSLLSHSWPGNIRELQNAVQRAAILSKGETPRQSDFLLSMSPSDQLNSLRAEPVKARSIHDMVEKIVDDEAARPSTGGLLIRSGTTVQEMEKALILETLRSTKNNRTEAAKLLGISIRTLRNKLNEYRGDSPVSEE